MGTSTFNLFKKHCLLLLLAFLSVNSFAQQTTLTTAVGTNYTGGNGVGGNSAITFAIENTNPYPVVLDSIYTYFQTASNNATVTLWYSATSLSGATGGITTPNWTVITTGTISVPANGYVPTFGNIAFTIPASTTYRFAVQSSASIRYSGAAGPPSPNSFSGAGVNLLSGAAQIAAANVGYGGAFPTPGNQPRWFTGAIVFTPQSSACVAPPTGGTTTGPANICPNTAFSLNVSGASSGSGISYQWESSPDNLTYTQINGATTSGYASSGITSATYFRRKIYCSGDSATATTLMVGINPIDSCYCVPTYGTGCGLGDEITNVSLATLNNTTACGPGSYNYYSAVAAPTLLMNTPYTLNVTVGTDGNQYAAAWIDFDHDGVFSATENLGISGNAGAGGTAAILFNVPAGSYTGITRMRVRAGNDSPLTNTQACGASSSAFGETEDYNVDIQMAPPCTTPTVGGTATGPATGVVLGSGTYVASGYTGSVQWQFASNPAGPWTFIPGAVTDTQVLFYNAPGTYYIRTWITIPGCDPDSSNFVMTVVVLQGDNVCDAVPLTFGTNGPYSTQFATVEVGEPVPPATGCGVQNGWCNSTLTNSLWFKFVAPPSGHVRLQSPNFDTQLALYSAASCNDVLLGGATLINANDDDPNSAAHGGVLFSSYIDSVLCLVPGFEYYVQLDPYASPGGLTNIVLTDLGLIDASFSNLPEAGCLGDTSTPLVPVIYFGVFAGPGINNGSLFTPDSAGAGTHEISYTLYGCYTSFDTVVVHPRPSVALDSVYHVDCNGSNTGAIFVTTSGGTAPYSFMWSNGDTLEDADSLIAGAYTIIVTDTNGCFATQGPDTILEPTALTSTLDNIVDASCYAYNDGQILTTTSGGVGPYTFFWSDSSNVEDLIGIFAGTYFATITDSNGCELNIGPHIVNQPTQIVPVLDSVTSLACNGDVNGAVYISVSGGNGPYIYVWNNGQVNQDIVNLPGGNYFSTVTDLDGCFSIAGPYTVVEPAAIGIAGSTVSNVTCNGLGNGVVDITVTGGTIPFTYSWSNSAVSEDLINVNPGTYSTTMVDANGCSFVAGPFIISEPTVLSSLVAASQDVACLNDNNGTIDVEVSGGTAPYSFSWSNAATSEDLTGLTSGTYTQTVTDANGCTDQVTVNITAPTTQLVVTSVSSNMTSATQLGTITVNATGGVPPYNYYWSNGQAENPILALPESVYFCTVVDANGCEVTIADTVDYINGITETGVSFSLGLFPNPTSGLLNINIDMNGSSEKVLVEIYTMNGQLVTSLNEMINNKGIVTVDLSNEATGMYTARVLVGDYSVSKRIAVTR